MADILLSLGVDTTQVRAQLETVAAQVQRTGVSQIQPSALVSPQLSAEAKMINDIMGRELVQAPKVVSANSELITKNKELEATYRKLGNEYLKQQNGVKGIVGEFQKALPRMLMWGIGWMAIYGTFRKITNVIGDVIKGYLDLDKAMARVGTVTRTTGNTQAETMSVLRQQVLDYARLSTVELTDVAKALYYLGTAGLTVSQEMAGMNYVMDLTIGTLGNIDQTGRLVAGAFNMFSKNIKNAVTDSEKFKKITDMIAFTYACYSPDTEVLTNKGWKLFTGLDKTETIATLNPKTKEIEYQKPTVYVNDPFKGKMCHLKGKFVDILVTPTHKLYAKVGYKPVKNEYKLIEAQDAFDRPKHFYRGSSWKGNNPKYFILPERKDKTRKKNAIKIPIKNWVRFMAWYLSEGYCTYSTPKRKQVYRVTIYQSKNSKYRNDLIETLKLMPFRFHEDENKTRCSAFVICNKQLCEYLKQFGKSQEKYLPDFIKNLSPELLRLFIKTYAYGDGYKRNDSNLIIVTSSKQLRDNFQEIALKADYGCTYHETKGTKKIINNIKTESKNIWHISISKRTEFLMYNKKNLYYAKKKNRISNSIERWEDYDGQVVCVEVPNHVIMVRRNGKSFWCGNTQQVELDEVASAFGYVGSASGLLDIDFKTLVGTIGFLNTGMLKGSKSGTALMNAFIQIADKSDLLGEKFGITLDPTKPLNFVEIMDQLHERIGGVVISTEQLRQLMDVFGNRGGRAVANIIGRFGEWKKAINVNEATFADYAELMRLKMEDTLPGVLKKFGQAVKINVIESLTPFFSKIKEIVSWQNKAIEAVIKEREERKLLNDLATYTLEKYQRIAEFGALTTDMSRLDVDMEKDKQIQVSLMKGHYEDFTKLGIPSILEEMKQKAELTGDFAAILPEETRKASERAREFNKVLAEAGTTEKDQVRLTAIISEAFQRIYGIEVNRAPKLKLILEYLSQQALESDKIVESNKKLTLEEEKRFYKLKEEARFQHLTNMGIEDYKVTQEKINFQIKATTNLIKDQKSKEEIITALTGLRADNLEEIFLQIKQYGVKEEAVAETYKLINEYQEQILARDREIVKIFSTQIEESLYNIIKGTGTWSDMLKNISDELLKLQLKRLVHKLTIDLFEQPTDKFGLAAQNFGNWVKEFGQHVYSLLTGQAPAGQTGTPIPSVPVAEKATISKEELLRNFGLAGTLGIGAALAQTETQPKQIFASKEDLIKNFGLTGIMGAAAAISKTQVEEKGKLGFDFTEKEKIDTTAMLVDRLDNYKTKLDEVNGSIERLESGEAQAFGISKQGWLDKLTEKANDYGKTISFVEDQIKQLGAVKATDQGLGGIAAVTSSKGLQSLKNAGAKVKDIMSEVFPRGANTGQRILGGIGGAMQLYQATQSGGGAQGAMAGAMGGGMLGMQLGGPTGAAIGLVAGGLLGYFSKKKAQETEHQTLQIASRIDVSNAQLQIISRNTSAMRRGFESWGIIPSSSYFSESMGVERRFSLSGMRGYYG
jgi:outer membrane lipoprotein SlyB